MKKKIFYVLIFSLITGSLWLTLPNSSRAGQYEIGSLDYINNADGSGNSSGSPADQSIVVYGTNNPEVLPNTVFTTCGGFLIIDGVNSGQIGGDLSSFSVSTTNLSNGSHSVSVQPDNCSSEFTATGTNTLTFYVSHPQKCNVSVSRSVNGGAAFSSSSYSYDLIGPDSVSTVNGSYTYNNVTVGNYTVVARGASTSASVTYQSRTFTADAGSNSVTCTANTTASLPLPYVTQPDLDIQ